MDVQIIDLNEFLIGEANRWPGKKIEIRYDGPNRITVYGQEATSTFWLLGSRWFEATRLDLEG